MRHTEAGTAGTFTDRSWRKGVGDAGRREP